MIKNPFTIDFSVTQGEESVQYANERNYFPQNGQFRRQEFESQQIQQNDSQLQSNFFNKMLDDDDESVAENHYTENNSVRESKKPDNSNFYQSIKESSHLTYQPYQPFQKSEFSLSNNVADDHQNNIQQNSLLPISFGKIEMLASIQQTQQSQAPNDMYKSFGVVNQNERGSLAMSKKKSMDDKIPYQLEPQEEVLKKMKLMEGTIEELKATLKEKNELLERKNDLIEGKNNVIQLNNSIVKEGQALTKKSSVKLLQYEEEINSRDEQIRKLQQQLLQANQTSSQQKNQQIGIPQNNEQELEVLKKQVGELEWREENIRKEAENTIEKIKEEFEWDIVKERKKGQAEAKKIGDAKDQEIQKIQLDKEIEVKNFSKLKEKEILNLKSEINYLKEEVKRSKDSQPLSFLNFNAFDTQVKAEDSQLKESLNQKEEEYKSILAKNEELKQQIWTIRTEITNEKDNAKKQVATMEEKLNQKDQELIKLQISCKEIGNSERSKEISFIESNEKIGILEREKKVLISEKERLLDEVSAQKEKVIQIINEKEVISRFSEENSNNVKILSKKLEEEKIKKQLLEKERDEKIRIIELVSKEKKDEEQKKDEIISLLNAKERELSQAKQDNQLIYQQHKQLNSQFEVSRMAIQKFEETQKDINDLRITNSNLEKSLHGLQEKFNEISLKNGQLQKQLQDTNINHEQQIKEEMIISYQLRSGKEECLKINDQLKRENSELKQNLQSSQLSFESLQKEKQKYQQEISISITAKDQELQSLKQQLAQEKRDNQLIYQQSKQMSIKLDQTQIEAKLLEEEKKKVYQLIQKQNETESEIKDKNKQIELLNGQMLSKEQEISYAKSNLNIERENGEQKNRLLEAFKKETESLKQSLDQVKSLLEKKNDSFSQINSNASIQQSLIDSKSQEIFRLQTQLQTSEEEIRNLKLQQVRNNFQKEKDAAIASKEKAYKEVLEKHNQSKGKEETLGKKVLEMENVMRVMDTEIESLKNQLLASNKQIEQMAYARKYESNQFRKQEQEYEKQLSQISPSHSSHSHRTLSAQSIPSMQANAIQDLNLSQISSGCDTPKDLEDDKIVLTDLANEILGLLDTQNKQSSDSRIRGGQFVSLSIEEENSVLAALSKIKNVIIQKLSVDLQNLKEQNNQKNRLLVRKHLKIVIKEINQLNSQFGVERWRKVKGGQEDKINQQTQAVDDFIRQFSGILISLDSKSSSSQNESNQITQSYSSVTHSKSQYQEAKDSTRLQPLIQKLEYPNFINSTYIPPKNFIDITENMKQSILQLLQQKSGGLSAQVDFTLIMISTETQREKCEQYIQEYLTKIPDSSKWKKTLAALLQRYAIASLASRTQNKLIDQTLSAASTNSKQYVINDNNFLFGQ